MFIPISNNTKIKSGDIVRSKEGNKELKVNLIDINNIQLIPKGSFSNDILKFVITRDNLEKDYELKVN